MTLTSPRCAAKFTRITQVHCKSTHIAQVHCKVHSLIQPVVDRTLQPPQRLAIEAGHPVERESVADICTGSGGESSVRGEST